MDTALFLFGSLAVCTVALGALLIYLMTPKKVKWEDYFKN